MIAQVCNIWARWLSWFRVFDLHFFHTHTCERVYSCDEFCVHLLDEFLQMFNKSEFCTSNIQPTLSTRMIYTGTVTSLVVMGTRKMKHVPTFLVNWQISLSLSRLNKQVSLTPST